MTSTGEFDLIRRGMEKVWKDNAIYIAKLEKKIQEFESEKHTLVLENKELASQVSDLTNLLYERNQTIGKLQTKLNEKSHLKDLNSLNMQLNKTRQENEVLRVQLEQSSSRSRKGCGNTGVKLEQDSYKVLSIVQNNYQTPQPSREPSHRSVRVKIEGKENLQSSQKLESTQSNEEPSVLEEDIEDDFEESKEQSYQATLDIRKSRPIIQESIQLKSKNFDLPSSSPPRSLEEHEDCDKYNYLNSSPIKSNAHSSTRRTEHKKETTSSQVIEIEDSQGPPEDTQLEEALPTPRTISKFQTPRIQNKTTDLHKRSLNQLHTPSDDTPMKRPRNLVAKSPSKIISSRSTLKLDLTRHPDEHRDWVIEDFKVNADKNNNTEYAYHIVLRGKDRQCVHGRSCHDCMPFYENLKGQGTAFSKWGPQWNDEQQDEKLFDIVSSTSRHRDLWTRPESPPGYGDFDMPGTQEQKELNQKADLLIRRTAYERLFSALNDRRYIFRNEKFNKAVNAKEFKINESIFLEYLATD